MSKDLTEALRALTEGSGTKDKPEPMKTRGAAASVKASVPLAGSVSGTGGIASPLTETAFSDREFWTGGFTSTDGLFVFPAIKKASFKDANDAPVVVLFAEPL